MHVIRFSRHPPWFGEAGTSLAETLTATALFLMALAVGASFQRFEFNTLSDQATQLNLQSSALTLADIFSRDLRRACGISVAATDSIRFQADLNGDGLIAGPDEDVTYVYDVPAQAVFRVSEAATEVVLSDVDLSGSRLRYFDPGGTELESGQELDAATRAAIRRVRLELALEQRSVDPKKSIRPHTELAYDIELRGRFFMNDLGTSTCVPADEEL